MESLKIKWFFFGFSSISITWFSLNSSSTLLLFLLKYVCTFSFNIENPLFAVDKIFY